MQSVRGQRRDEHINKIHPADDRAFSGAVLELNECPVVQTSVTSDSPNTHDRNEVDIQHHKTENS